MEKLMIGSLSEMTARFEKAVSELEVRVEHGIRYGYLRKPESGRYPTVEEFFVVAPAVVESKTRYGFEWFEAKWKLALGEIAQEKLFD